jgi:glycolate oxidase
MAYNKLTAGCIDFFQSVAGTENVHSDSENLSRCASDQTEDLAFPPEVVVRPSSAAEISQILKYCHENHIPVTPRGAGTGLSGGALPVYGGVCLDTARLNNILKIDKRNFQVTTEPGVVTQVLQDTLKAEGLYYPPDPASKGSCFIGGNIAENSGGPHAVKYGVVKDYVLNLEVVLADGSIIWTGANVLKNATGYNLTQLMVGSEGTLGIVTKIVLRTIPAVQYDVVMLVPFRSAVEACAAVNAVFLAGFTPSAIEFMERDALDWAMRYVGDSSIDVAPDTQAHLLIELDGNFMEELFRDAEAITQILQGFDIGEILFADDNARKQTLWNLRRKVGEAVKRNSTYKEEDTVVPRAELPALLETVKRLGSKYGFKSVCYGHAGDGNLHVNIVKGDMPDDDWKHGLTAGIRELFTEVVRLGGTISGEHGIGWVQAPYMDIAFGDRVTALMENIKLLFDPHKILNPGKIFKSHQQ